LLRRPFQLLLKAGIVCNPQNTVLGKTQTSFLRI